MTTSPNPRVLGRRPFGQTGLSVAPLGLAGSFGIDADGVQRAFHELGVNYFFITPRTKQMVEGVRRLVADGHRQDIVIAAGASIPVGATIGFELDKVCKRLGVDTIDVWHLFWVQGRWYVKGKTWPKMRAFKQSGRVGHLAISCHDRVMARALVDELELDALMIRYNAAHRGAEREIFESLGDDRPGIISYTATRWGRLLKPAGELGPMNPAECYRFALGHPKVDVALCGASSFEELAADVRGVLDGPLDPARLEEIKRFGDAVRSTATGRIGFAGV